MAESQWAPDGTQPPDPVPFAGDPLAGLVTGVDYVDGFPEPLKVRVERPDMPDVSNVRAAVDAVLAGEDQPPVGPSRRTASGRAVSSGTAPGILPRNPRAGWPSAPSVLRLAGRRVQRPPVPPRRPAVHRSITSPGSINLAGLVLAVLVFIVVAIVVINGVVATISGVLN